MKRILYLMHVPWRWVKQRPHFIAEHLAGSWEVEVYFRKLYCIGRQLTNDFPSQLSINELPVLPLERFAFVWNLNCRIFSYQVGRIIDRYGIVWITHPLMFDMVERKLPPSVKVVYDCMDDALEFPRIRSNPRLRQAIADSERALVQRSDMIFTSSRTLYERLEARYGQHNSISVVPNAVFLDDIDPLIEVRPDIKASFLTARCRLTYIGTISEWFDFQLILDALDAFKELTVFLFGPCEIAVPQHDRLVYFGPVDHRDIYRIMAMSDALVMPFQINDLVLGVDPVKLYEYTFACKPVLAVDYPETRKFSDYVYLYQDKAGFLNFVAEVVAGRLLLKESPHNHKAFAAANTWRNRSQHISNVLEKEFKP